MIFRLVDLIIGINAIIGISAWLSIKLNRRRKSANIEHTKELLEENKEIDRMIEEMRDGKDN